MMNIRVTNAATYRKYTTSVNNLHARLNKNMNKISSGKEYESAAESPLSYYQSKKIDSQYQETLSKLNLIKDVSGRLEQQEDGVYDIQQLLKGAKNDMVLKGLTGTTSPTAMATLRDDLVQKSQMMVNDLNSQYQDFYVYGGNDATTPPFSLSSDASTLTYTHVFPGENTPTKFVMELKRDDATGEYSYDLTEGDISKLVQAMSEQGSKDLGYGDIRDRDTLMDTYTGGMNVLTGMNSDAVKSQYPKLPLDPADEAAATEDIMKRLKDGPLGLVAQSVMAMNKYLDPADPLYDKRDVLQDDLERLVQDMTVGEHTVSTFYSDLGTKYHTLETTKDKLDLMSDSLKTQYANVAGADPYQSIMEMFDSQYAYKAALQLGSNLMSSSLFDFVR